MIPKTNKIQCHTIFINESGFYDLILNSKLPNAKKIQILSVQYRTSINSKEWNFHREPRIQ